MAQYLLSVHSVEGEAREPMTDEEMQQFMERIGVLEEEMKSAGAWVFAGRLHEPDTATVVRVSGGEVLTTDGPFAESKEHLGGFYIIEAEDLDAALAWASKATAAVSDADRGPSVPGRTRGLTAVRDVDAAPKLDEAAIGRIFREESGRSVATLIRVFGDIDVAEDAVQEAFAVALRRWPRDGLPPNPGGWITTTARNRAIDRLRRESRGRELLSEVACSRPARRSRHARGGGTRAGRPASPHLHLLPPGALRGSAGGAHAPAARRPVDRGGRASLPGHRADDGATSRARQAQDQGRPDPLPRAGGSRAARPPAPRAGRRLPHLQRRADQPGRAGSLRGGDPAGADPGDAHARRARGGRPAGAAAPDRVPSRVANAARRLPRAARRAGPHPVGSRPDRGGTGDRPPLPSPQPTRPVSAPGRHQRRARRRRRPSSRPTGRRSSPCTTSCSRSPPRRSWPSTAPSPSARSRAPQPRWRWWTSWTWTTTTRSTPREPICFGGSAATARPRPPTSARPPWRRPTPSGTSSGSVAEPPAEEPADERNRGSPAHSSYKWTRLRVRDRNALRNVRSPGLAARPRRHRRRATTGRR